MSVEAMVPSLGATDDLDLLENSVPQVLTFIVADEIYGIPISHIAEIIGVQRLTPVPDSRAFMKGVINLRGTVIPVMDVRSRFGMEPKEADGRTCIVVVEFEETVVGLLVDTISDVIDVPPKLVEAAPRRKASAMRDSVVTGFIQIDGEVKILIDLRRLLHGCPTDPDNQEEQQETQKT